MKKKSRQQRSQANPYQALFKALGIIKNAHEAKLFLSDLCSPSELQAMADRWQVVNLIKNGYTYRQISEKTGISVTTVGRVARCLFKGNNGYSQIHQRLQDKK